MDSSEESCSHLSESALNFNFFYVHKSFFWEKNDFLNILSQCFQITSKVQRLDVSQIRIYRPSPPFRSSHIYMTETHCAEQNKKMAMSQLTTCRLPSPLKKSCFNFLVQIVEKRSETNEKRKKKQFRFFLVLIDCFHNFKIF